MHFIVLSVFTLYVAVTVGSAKCTDAVTKTCESWENKYTECDITEATEITDVNATNVLSGGFYSCTKGGTYGWNGHILWVYNGCRAVFKVCYERYTCPNRINQRCESLKYATEECHISGTAVVTHASVSTLYSSDSDCLLNTDFGWNTNEIWVTNGCQADFDVCFYDDVCPNEDRALCESQQNEYTECEIGSNTTKIIYAAVDTVHSPGGVRCDLDDQFGWKDNKLWVNHGCRADFKICYEKEAAIGPCIEKRNASCESSADAYEECEIGQAGYLTSVKVLMQSSASPCIYEHSYGFFDNKLWVHKGCRAEFEVCYVPGNGPCGKKGIRNCESFDQGYHECEIFGAARVTSVIVGNLKDGECTYATSFGMFANNIWVDLGCRANFIVCYEIPSEANPEEEIESTGEVNLMGVKVAPHQWCYDDYPILDGLLCYEACRSGYSNHGGGPLCWGACPSNTIDFGLFCTKKSYGRGGGKPLSTCDAASDKNGLLCYPKCRDGYYGVGPVCWQRCRSGYTDDGALCRRNAHIYGRDVRNCPWHDKCGLCGGPWYNVCGKRRDCGGSCNSGYKNDGCTCRRDVHIYAKRTYGRGAGEAMDCKEDEEKDGALCYPYCASGYNGVGPVCWVYCSGETIDTGAQCQKKAYGRGVGKVINCLKVPTLEDITNSSGLVAIMEEVSDKDILLGMACAALYTRVHFWIVIAESFNNCHKEETWTTVSLAYSAEAAAGVSVSSAVGIAVNIKTGKGLCFVGYCIGVKSDVSLGAAIELAWWRSLEDIPGESTVFAIGVDIPFTEMGFSATFITNTDGEYIGTQVSLGVGVGLLPFEVGFSSCSTPEDAVVLFVV